MPRRGQGAADLGEVPTIRGPASRGGVHRPVGAIGIEGHGQPVALEDSAQGGHDRQRALAALTELGVEDLGGGVIHDDEEGEPPLRH